MIITKIEQQKKRENRYSIFIDNEFSFGLDEIDLLFYKLKENTEISESKYNEIIENAVFQKAKDTAFKYLGYKARSRFEVENKLKEKEFSEDIIFKVMDMLERYGYIDDKIYAKKFISEKINFNGYGKHKIKYELRLKKVDEEIIEELLQDTDEDELEKAIKLVEKKSKNKVIDYKEKQKIVAYLQRRGYSYDIIKESIDTVLSEDY